MTSERDADGQPFNLSFNRARRTERDVSELLGLVKGVMGDGEVSEGEARLVRDWVIAHPDAGDFWPVNILSERLVRIFEDGAVSEEERSDLAGLLSELVGGGCGIICCNDTSTALPLDTPQPEIVWSGSIFVFTGRFAFGPRSECERWTTKRDGICEFSLTKRTNYLVIGTFGSRDWVHTSFGRKIEKAVAMREKWRELSIIAEDHWAEGIVGRG